MTLLNKLEFSDFFLPVHQCPKSSVEFYQWSLFEQENLRSELSNRFLRDVDAEQSTFYQRCLAKQIIKRENKHWASSILPSPNINIR